MRVAIYCRVSTDEQAREGTSIDYQLSRLRQWADSNQHTIVGEYVDAGYSGKTDDRPQLKRLMADAKKFDAVLTVRLDRFFRNLRLLLEYKDRLAKQGVSYLALENSVDTSTPFGGLVFNVLGVVSEWERELIRDRTREGRLQSWRSGKITGGNTLYGYSRSPDGKPTINADKASVVQKIYSLYLSGLGTARIAEKLNAESIPPPSGRNNKAWSESAVLWVLKHPAYAGEARMNRSNPWKHDSGDIVLEYPVIVPKDTWDQVQRRMSYQKRLGRRKPEDQWLLQGLIKCYCGHGYQCYWHQRTRPRTYSCWGRAKKFHLDGSPRCTSPILKAAELEDAVWNAFAGCLQDKDLLRQSIINSLETAEQRKQELASLCEPINQQLNKIRDQLSRVDVMYELGRMGEPKYRQRVSDLQRQERELTKRRTEIDPDKMLELEILEGYLSWAREFWKTADIQLSSNGKVLGTDPDADDLLVGLTSGTIDLATGLESSLLEAQTDGNLRRQLLERFNVVVYVMSDGRVELRGYLPTCVLPINSTMRIWSPSAE